MSPRRHEQLGWGMLALFIVLGVVLETLHGLKVTPYLAETYATGRLLWTLAHAHGALLGLVHLGFASTLRSHESWTGAGRTWASRCLVWGAVLLPGGFFSGGAWLWGNDPNPLVLFSPLGGLLLGAGAALTWRELRRLP